MDMEHCNNDPSTVARSSLKRHAACDECRNRKLKCSGETTGCTRCIKQSLVCHYSIQKQMGRPPKKRMREDGSAELGDAQENEERSALDNGQFSPFDLGGNAAATSEAPGIFPQVYCAPFQMPRAFPDLPHDRPWLTWDSDGMHPLPATTSPWPDFSSVSAAIGSRPLSPSQSTQDSPSSAVPCSCLSYLYLCLSHLSSLAPFPISHHTLCSLFIGAKTARDIIRCEECPKIYATGIQNVMFTGTLLNVIADAWLQVSKTDPVELGQQAAPPVYVASLTQKTPNPAEGWKTWLRQTVRNAVIGGAVDPAGRVRCSDAPNLISLVIEFEERQRRWHSERDALSWLQRDNDSSISPESHDKPSNGSGEAGHEKDYLCLRVIGSVREVISKFNFEPHEYPDGNVF